MSIAKFIFLFVSAGLLPSVASAETYNGDDAKNHIGETATVCGTVVSADYAVRARGKPTFLNFDKPYPNETFTAVIWDENRLSFGTPETTLMGKHMCATGVIRLYKGRPEIILRNPVQLKQQ
jgi:DNA/RNA endonuclease YhcR with UshA esterase domain